MVLKGLSGIVLVFDAIAHQRITGKVHFFTVPNLLGPQTPAGLVGAASQKNAGVGCGNTALTPVKPFIRALRQIDDVVAHVLYLF